MKAVPCITLVMVLLLSVVLPAGAAPSALRCTAPDEVTHFKVTLPYTARAIRRGTALVIVAIGSSSTQGVGASDQAHTYPALLAEKLRHKRFNLVFQEFVGTPGDEEVVTVADQMHLGALGTFGVRWVGGFEQLFQAVQSQIGNHR